jgi:hypothetical protein
MAQPVSAPIISTPSVPGQPYDPAEGETPGWTKLDDNAGPANINTGRVTGEFADSGVWKQV